MFAPILLLSTEHLSTRVAALATHRAVLGYYYKQTKQKEIRPWWSRHTVLFTRALHTITTTVTSRAPKTSAVESPPAAAAAATVVLESRKRRQRARSAAYNTRRRNGERGGDTCWPMPLLRNARIPPYLPLTRCSHNGVVYCTRRKR